MNSLESDDSHYVESIRAAEAVSRFKQSYRMHRMLINLNHLDVNGLDDTDQVRVETASVPLTPMYEGIRRQYTALFPTCKRSRHW